MSDVREPRAIRNHVLDLADYETEVTKEDVTVLKDDWLTDNVWINSTVLLYSLDTNGSLQVIAFWEECAPRPSPSLLLS
jgi:hypothetical protein